MSTIPALRGWLSFTGRLNASLRRLPSWSRPYAVSLAALALAFVIAWTLLRTVGPKANIVVSMLGDVVFLGSAWLGYGPGVLICSLIVFIVPPLLAPDRPFHPDLGQFVLLTVISLLVSRIASSKRRNEALLRQWGETLESRVQERTLELQRNERRLAWLAAIVESSDDAIIGEALDGTITSWNRGASVLYQYSPEEMIGRSKAILYPEGRHEGEVVQGVETVHIRKDGSPVVVSLTTSPIPTAEGEVQGVSTIARDMTAQRAAKEALEHSEQRYRLLFENSPEPMWVYDPKTLSFLTVNDTAIRSYGYSREEFLAMTLLDIAQAEETEATPGAAPNASGEINRESSGRHRKKDGKVIAVSMTEHPIEFEGRPARLVIANDVTDHLRLEEQLRQAQRLESVGRLAGGIAHDFNNLLTVINGYVELLLAEPMANASSAIALREIREAGSRAEGLTKQLLAFSRQQVLQPTVINLNTVVTSTETFLRRLIGEDINLVAKLAPDLGQVVADAGQVQQIIMNLVTNSRDAMPNGGMILIETSNVYLDEGYQAQHPSMRPGAHVMMAVTDTGTGMSAEIRAQIFEPFYTTKGLGKGTGLGLATVYGMVKQGGGWIWVYSEPGRGTTFKIYLPRTDKPPSLTTPSVAEGGRGDETILVVEDQAEVRTLAVTGLTRFGYTVHAAATGAEALRFCQEFGGEIDLVVTDVVMPDMNGRELAVRVCGLRPAVPILFMSGYTSNVIVHHGVLDENVEYLQKPFTPESLARRVRQVLGPKPDRQA